jgi:hypothetical protein
MAVIAEWRNSYFQAENVVSFFDGTHGVVGPCLGGSFHTVRAKPKNIDLDPGCKCVVPVRDLGDICPFCDYWHRVSSITVFFRFRYGRASYTTNNATCCFLRDQFFTLTVADRLGAPSWEGHCGYTYDKSYTVAGDLGDVSRVRIATGIGATNPGISITINYFGTSSETHDSNCNQTIFSGSATQVSRVGIRNTAKSICKNRPEDFIYDRTMDSLCGCTLFQSFPSGSFFYDTPTAGMLVSDITLL